MTMHRKLLQYGYTFLEMLIVLLIIMMLAINMLPRYFKLVAETKSTNLISLAALLGTIASTNYVVSKTQPTDAFKVRNCTDLSRAFDGGSSFPKGYAILPETMESGQTVVCLIVDEDNNQASFMAVGTL